MKFVTSQNAILKALTLVFGGIAKSPEHSMVKLKAEKELGLITFETSNLDVKIKSFLPAQVEVNGEASVELVKLAEIIKKLSQLNEVSIEFKDSSFTLKNGKSKFLLKGKEVEKETKISENNVKSSFKIMSKKLLLLIEKTKFSIYPDETRFNLNGLLFQFKNENNLSLLTTVSTDGHRLSLCKVETSLPESANFPRIILPKKTTLELKKILETTEDEEIEFSLLEKQVGFNSKSFNFISKLIDAEFPEYEKVIPQENKKIVTISRKELISLIERVCAIYTNSSENSIKLSFHKNLVTILAKNKDAGEANDELIVECDFEEQLEVSYNYNYLIEILSHISSEKIRFYFKDERTPALIKDEKLESYFYILMPMRF